MEAEHLVSIDLPEYENPPVTEVVCGVLFNTLEAFSLPYLGLFWECVRDEYPKCQEVAPLMPLIENFGENQGSTFQLGNDFPVPRIWFLSREEAGIIQVQRDRFLHNWKKSADDSLYPRYHAVIDLFKKHLSTFENFVGEHGLGKVTPIQYEMTYVNHIPQGDNWHDFSDLGGVLHDYDWTRGRFLTDIEHLNFKTTFALPKNQGRLHVSIRDAKRRSDSKPTLLFELTVRGFPTDQSTEARWQWFDLAREWIVRGFTDLTTQEIQEKVWRRTR